MFIRHFLFRTLSNGDRWPELSLTNNMPENTDKSKTEQTPSSRSPSTICYPGSLREAVETQAASADLFAVDKFKDWPFGQGENDNYHHECCSCEGKYRGHKRSIVCYACHKASVKWWDSLSEKDKERITQERYAEMNRLMGTMFKKDNAIGDSRRADADPNQTASSASNPPTC